MGKPYEHNLQIVDVRHQCFPEGNKHRPSGLIDRLLRGMILQVVNQDGL